MCLALFKPHDKTITRQALYNGFMNNQHGAGFCYPEEGKMIVKKGYFDFELFWKDFNEIQQKQVPMLGHCRYKTHGDKTEDNCHPWQIDEQTAMVHNGQFKQFPNKKLTLSDTGQFVEEILKPMFVANPSCFDEKWISTLLEEYMGVGNKVIILNADGKWVIYRADMGEWSDGIWFSNDGYKTLKYKSSNEVNVGVYKNSNSGKNNKVNNYYNFGKEFDMTEVDAMLEKMTKERNEKNLKNKKAFDGGKTQVLTKGISPERAGEYKIENPKKESATHGAE